MFHGGAWGDPGSIATTAAAVMEERRRSEREREVRVLEESGLRNRKRERGDVLGQPHK